MSSDKNYYVPQEICNLVTQMNNMRNDGYTVYGFRKQLLDIREYIDKAIKTFDEKEQAAKKELSQQPLP
jgi:hypothetical protein